MQSQRSLQQISMEIKQGFDEFKAGLEEQVQEVHKKQEEVLIVFKEAALKGDLSENAEYENAEKELAMYNAALLSLNNQLKSINLVDNTDYYPIGLAVMYSTVTLSNSLGDSYVVQIYPEGVSDISRHILAKDSLVGSSVWMKKVGDTFHTEHRITGERIEWRIDDVY